MFAACLVLGLLVGPAMRTLLLRAVAASSAAPERSHAPAGTRPVDPHQSDPHPDAAEEHPRDAPAAPSNGTLAA